MEPTVVSFTAAVGACSEWEQAWSGSEWSVQVPQRSERSAIRPEARPPFSQAMGLMAEALRCRLEPDERLPLGELRQRGPENPSPAAQRCTHL